MVLGLTLAFVVGLSQAPQAEACSSGCGTYYPPVYYPPTQTTVSPLYVQCYPQPLTANVGDSATWVSNVSGGVGSYSYSWSGTDGLTGAGPSISKVYYTSGSKSATMTVSSGSQTKSVSCSGSVTVYGNSYNDYPPVYQPPVYVPPTYYPPTYYSPLQVSCTPNVTYTNTGSTVTWSANVYGGNTNGYYGITYSWSGTDGLYGYGQSISTTYNTPGYKTASVTVNANGQTASQICGSSVNVSGYNNYAYQTSYYNTYSNYGSNNGGLNVGCYSDPQVASLNQPITWSVEVTGGVGPYTYSWSGTESLTGSGNSVVKYYNSYGEKSAIVTVTSADGKTSTRACSNTLNVRRAGGASTGTTVTTPTKTTTDTKASNNSQSAAALFSLQNIPWGWVAILIIIVLFATILYLIYNRPKI